MSPSRLSELDVADLVAKARTGCRAAFDELMRRYRQALVGYLRGRGLRDRAEDVAEDVWVAVWQDLPTPPDQRGYDADKGAFFTWVVKRFGLPFSRRRTKTRAVSLDGRGQAGHTPADGELAELEQQWRRQVVAYSELLRVTFCCGGYPHQVLAFGLSKLIHGRQSDRAIEGSPATVCRTYGAVALDEVANAFLEQYTAVSGLAATELDQLASHAQPVFLRLRCTVAELTQDDAPSRGHLRRILGKVVGETCFEDYYRETKRGPSAALADWCYKVEKRVREVVAAAPGRDLEAREALEVVREAQPGPQVCTYCKLRHLPPCSRSETG